MDSFSYPSYSPILVNFNLFLFVDIFKTEVVICRHILKKKKNANLILENAQKILNVKLSDPRDEYSEIQKIRVLGMRSPIYDKNSPF